MGWDGGTHRCVASKYRSWSIFFLLVLTTTTLVPFPPPSLREDADEEEEARDTIHPRSSNLNTKNKSFEYRVWQKKCYYGMMCMTG